MCSYSTVNGSYACQNPYLLTTALRQQFGFGGVVTSDWHMRRAVTAFRRHFKTVIPYPSLSDYSLPVIPGSFLPSSSSLDASTEELHEWIGIAWYALRG